MQIEKVTVNFQRKKNLGNYESADASCMLTAYVEPGDDKDTVMRGLWAMAKANVKAALAPYLQGVTAEELFLGLPVEVQESPHFAGLREQVAERNLRNTCPICKREFYERDMPMLRDVGLVCQECYNFNHEEEE